MSMALITKEVDWTVNAAAVSRTGMKIPRATIKWPQQWAWHTFLTLKIGL